MVTMFRKIFMNFENSHEYKKVSQNSKTIPNIKMFKNSKKFFINFKNIC